MKNNVTDGLNNAFGVESDLVEVEVVDNSPSLRREIFEEKTAGKEEVDKDYHYARDNMYDVIEKGTEALDYLLELAKQSEHPRAFEVVSTLTKTLVDANKDLLDLQQKLKKIKQEDNKSDSTSPQNVTNALFVGSTSDLQKLLKGENGD
jgi:hypothetical protein